MSEPPLKISVATVTYNAAELIEKTIASVETQDYPYVEHIIVDGNSQDTTLEAVHHYQERNSVADVRHEIVCLSEPDEGLYDAMNKALDLATGEYILFLNAGAMSVGVYSLFPMIYNFFCIHTDLKAPIFVFSLSLNTKFFPGILKSITFFKNSISSLHTSCNIIF